MVLCVRAYIITVSCLVAFSITAEYSIVRLIEYLFFFPGFLA